MDYLNVKFFFVGVCFFLYIGGTASGPPSISGMPQSVLSFNETNKNITLLAFIVTDEGTVTIEPNNADTRNFVLDKQQIINSQSAPLNEYNVTVRNIKPLDRDQGTGGQNLYIISFKITDSEGNTVATPQVYISVDDVNDNPPQFRNLPYRWDIDEKPCNISAVYTIISATDVDSGENARLSYSMKPNTKSHSAKNEYKNHFNITPDTGVVHLLNKLDYEENSYYQFTVTVNDQGNPPQNATADLIIRVNDVQDTPPFFTARLYRTNMDENVPTNTSVIQVTARDGDLGVSNEVAYSIRPDGECSELFHIDEDGWIRTNASIDRDTGVLLNKNGECTLTVEVNEIDQNITHQYGATFANTSVTITINDLDDNSPRFNKSEYYGTIPENSGAGDTISIPGGIFVSDADQANNAKMDIHVTFFDGSNCSLLTADPSSVIQNSEIRIKVTNYKNDPLLDYEQTKYFELLVTVTESRNTTLSGSAVVKVNVTDVNDNVPQFLNGSYEFSIQENTSNGTYVGNVTATDKDVDGTDKLSYSLLGGQWFTIDSATGYISTDCAPNNLNRERQDTFYMTLTVIDTASHRNTSSLVVKLTDENDNPPIFGQDIYEVRIKENEDYKSKPIFRVEAKDADFERSMNSRLYYNITETSDANFFNNVTINASTGELFLRHLVDYETIQSNLNGSINITIMSFDNGQPPLNDTTIVRFSVQDTNDCPPLFNQSVYCGKTFENETSLLNNEFPVATVHADDGDGTDRNRGINYFIVSGSAGKFRVDPLSGVVSIQVDAQLDYELKEEYNVTVMALDQGSPSLNSTTVVSITIKDVNDVTPMFRPNSCSMKVFDNRPQGPFNPGCNAADPDTDNKLQYNISVLYAFDEVGHPINVNLTKGWFLINEANGNITVTESANREIAKTVQIQIFVEDLNAVDPKSQNDTATLSITLEDINDNNPEFTSKVYNGSVSEKAPNNTHVLTVSATDKDENRTITYSLQNPHAAFTIDTKTGILSKVGDVDRETNATISLTAVATDNGVPSLNSTVPINIDIIDFNDNAPVFLNFERIINITENATNGTFVVVANATDADAGENARVTYKISAGDTGQKFDINEDTGDISVASTLDREKVALYDLTIEASDNPEDHALRKANTTHVYIKISDINDNPPTFSDSYYGRIPETATNGTMVLRVVATDLDDGENKDIIYTMEDDNPLFSISKDGNITVVHALTDKVGLYNLTVNCTDQGNPQLMGNVTVQISVEDVNLHPPKIGNMPLGSLIRVYECETQNTVIWTFNYTDGDYGQNANSTFNIREYDQSSTLNNNTFVMSTDGRLTLNKTVDVNIQAEYKFFLRVTDQGIPNHLSSETLVTVNLIDVNNHLPTFNSSETRLKLRENSTSHIQIGKVQATDKDKDGIPCYRFKDETVNANWTNYFDLNKTTGEITNNQPVDYETVKSIELHIYVDDCSIQTNASCANTSSQPQRIPDITVNVDIEDVNDNPPVFDRDLTMFNIGMVHGTELGSVLELKLKNETYVHDNDSKSFASDSWAFSNAGPVIVSADLMERITPGTGVEKCADNQTHLFCVTGNGTIVANKIIDETLSGYFIVPIKVKDAAGEDKTNITIYLISKSQIVTMVLRHGKEEASAMKDDIMRMYGQITGYKFVFDKLSNHRKDDKVFSTSSDLEFHVVNPVTQEVLQAEDVFKLLEKKSEDPNLINLMNKYNIETSLQALSDTKTGTDDNSKRTFYILLGVTCGEALVIFVVIYVWMNTKNRYKRKLKAANINVKDFEMNEMEEIVPVIPGSNMFSKSKNPLIDADIKDVDTGMAFNNDSYQNNDDMNIDDNAVDTNGEHMHTVYDTLEEKEVTMDMYTDDTPGAGRSGSVSSEDLLGATLQLHALHKSMDSLDRFDDDHEEEDMFQARTRVNPAFDDDLECTDI